MRVIKSNHYGGNYINQVLKDDSNEIVAVFEDKSSVLGNKVAVFDDDGNGVYFLDEDLSGRSYAFIIQKGSDIIGNVEREDGFVHRHIKIDAKGAEYEFSFAQRVLHKDNKKIAKLTVNNDKSLQIDLFEDEEAVFICTLLYAVYMLLV